MYRKEIGGYKGHTKEFLEFEREEEDVGRIPKLEWVVGRACPLPTTICSSLEKLEALANWDKSEVMWELQLESASHWVLIFVTTL